MYQVYLPQSLEHNEKYRKIPFLPVIRRGFIKQHNVSFAQNHKYPKKHLPPLMGSNCHFKEKPDYISHINKIFILEQLKDHFNIKTQMLDRCAVESKHVFN